MITEYLHFREVGKQECLTNLSFKKHLKVILDFYQ